MSEPTATPPVYIMCRLCGEQIRFLFGAECWIHYDTGDLRCNPESPDIQTGEKP